MNGRRCSKPSSSNWKPWCVMDSKHNKYVPIIRWKQLRWLWCGAQGVNQKIQLHPKHDWIGRENTKKDDKWEAHKQWSMEALACLCKHLGAIKFLAMHIKTMWWNGGTLRKMLDYNMKYFPITNNHTLLRHGGLDMEGRTWLIAFMRNHVKLAWAFISIMNVIQHCEILHNDLSKDNIMLHFLAFKPNVVYIGMCNWGEARHL